MGDYEAQGMIEESRKTSKRISELEAEVERLNDNLSSKERTRHLDTLKRVEWASYLPNSQGYIPTGCPVCERPKYRGHANDCQIAADIKRLEGMG